MDEALEELQFLFQSTNRARVLLALATSGPLTRDELEARLDASRRTVVRLVAALEDRGYVAETADGLVLTPFGTTVATSATSVTDETTVAVQYRPLLRHGPPDFRSIELEALAGAECIVASDSSPFAVLDRILDAREGATRLRELAPGIQRQSVEQLADRVRRDEDLDVEIVLPEDAVRTARSRSAYREHFETALASDDVAIFAHPEPIDFAIGIADETAYFAVSREEQPHAVALSTDQNLVDWASDRFGAYRQEARRLTDV